MFKFFSRLSDSNEREIRALQPIVDRINALEPEIQALSDAELRLQTPALQRTLGEEFAAARGELERYLQDRQQSTG